MSGNGEDQPFFQKILSNTYYKLMRKFALKNMPYGGFDCFLIDKKVVENIVKMKEKNRDFSLFLFIFF